MFATSLRYSPISGPDVTDDLLGQCAELFSSNYGVWGVAPHTPEFKHVVLGQRVKMTIRKLRSECFSTPENTVLVTCFHNDKLIGHAFATVWSYDGGVVGWVTQLVVDANYRRRYIATQLIQTLKLHSRFHDITAIGLVSTQPASVHALSKYGTTKINELDTTFIAQNAKKILSESPVRYLKNASLRGSIFEGDNCRDGSVSCLYTEFYVDHKEPLQVLQTYKTKGLWCLGELPEGHEFLIIIPVNPHSQ